MKSPKSPNFQVTAPKKARFILSLLAFLSVGVTSVHAATDHSAHDAHAHSVSKPSAENALVDAEVKKVDKAAGRVTLAHGPLLNLNMPPMTMAFAVKDQAWLGRMKAGDKIRFKPDNLNGVLTVVQYEAVK